MEASIALIFLFTASVFIIYDCIAERRNMKAVASAKKSRAIVNSLFPSTVRERLYANADDKTGKAALASLQTPKLRLQTFLSSGPEDRNHHLVSEPIADLFPHATIMFADIAGFTAWSSEREPSQVFTLLETLYVLTSVLDVSLEEEKEKWEKTVEIL